MPADAIDSMQVRLSSLEPGAPTSISVAINSEHDATTASKSGVTRFCAVAFVSVQSPFQLPAGARIRRQGAMGGSFHL